jgi:hypothetical protein
MPVFIAIAGAWAAIHYGIIPVDQTRAAYASFVLPFGFGIALYLALQIVRAPFVLDREQREKIDGLVSDLKKEREANKPTPMGKLLMASLDPTLIAQNRLAEALERQGEREDRARVSRVINPPGPRTGLQVACESNQARLFVENGGATAEFYGVFTIAGTTAARPGDTHFCK